MHTTATQKLELFLDKRLRTVDNLFLRCSIVSLTYPPPHPKKAHNINHFSESNFTYILA